MQINVNGKSFNVAETDMVNHSNHWGWVNDGSWEPHTFKIFDEFIDSDHTYIDMGAWIGSTVLYGAQLAKHVYTAEPDPIALTALKTNIDLNPELKEKISLYEGAVIQDGTMKLSKPTGDSVSTVVGTAGDTNDQVTVNTVSFDTFLNTYNIEDCNFIKMDIEGAEKIVLPAISDYLNINKPSMYISFHPWNFNDTDKNNIKEALNCYSHFCRAQDRQPLSIDNILNEREIIAWI